MPNSSANKQSSGWPVVPPPDLDLPTRPVPRAPLTDVVPRRTLLIIAVVVVLAVLGTVLAFVLNGDDGKDDKSGGAKAVASAGASAKRDKGTGGGTETGPRTDGAGSASASTGSTPDAEASRSADSDDDSGDGSSGSKDGGSAPVVSTRKGAQGYSIGLPKGWKYQSSGAAGDRYTGPAGQKLLVAWTGTPKDDPVADWKNQEHYMVRSQYHRIRIEQVDYHDWNTADWEFTYVEGGTEYRTIDRGFVVNDHLGYALMYTAKDADWHGELRKDTWKTLTKSFEPKS